MLTILLSRAAVVALAVPAAVVALEVCAPQQVFL